MSLKLFGIMAPVVLGGLWFTGAVGGSAYSRVVDRSPAQVMAALDDLDVRGRPGTPGVNIAQSRSEPPLFRTERGENRISLVLMSGNQVATRMTAHLEPLDGGRRTRVTASVERGDAPDDFVSPAFRSKVATLSLFVIALEDELNELTAPPRKSRAECQEIMQRLLLANAPSARPGSWAESSQTIMAVQAVEAELRRQGCPTDWPVGAASEPVSSVMSDPDPNARRPDGVNFAPGQPMIDVRRNGSR